MTLTNRVSFFLLLHILLAAAATRSSAKEWKVPFAGNSYHTGEAESGRGRISRQGGMTLSGGSDRVSLFFHVDRASTLSISLQADSGSEDSQLKVTHNGQAIATATLDDQQSALRLGDIETTEPGYVRVDFQLPDGNSSNVKLEELGVASEAADLTVEYVASNKGNMFYWGRRGPSVHLRYQTPRNVDLRYAYTEITVPEGQDPLGTFYMANGFGEGYFGFQVNSPTQRRVLFSVWSPFKTDNPREIPAEQRIELLAKGRDVHTGEFGNEGSGGQSYLVYPWKAGRTYRFLTKVQPDDEGSTIYTSWFGDKSKEEWRLIASFRRPQTNTNLRSFHSFLEGFNPSTGYIGRRASYGNIWVCDVDGNWQECTQARFSTDATGSGRHRLDFGGGAEGNSFYLRNCGFFESTSQPGETYQRESSSDQMPDIEFSRLPL